MTSRARCASPTIASAETSQNEQMRNVPSRPDRPSVGLLGAVAKHEPVLGQLVPDGERGLVEALVVGREEPGHRREQRRRIERAGFVVLAENPSLADSVRNHVGVDLLACGAPRRPELGITADLGEGSRAVKGYPAHDLRGRIVLRLPARLPDALVRVAPDSDRAFGL